jgi:hypothetical protein
VTRRTPAQRAEARASAADVDALIESKESALRTAVFAIRDWRWGAGGIRDINALRDLARRVDVEAETLVELIGRRKRAAGKPI